MSYELYRNFTENNLISHEKYRIQKKNPTIQRVLSLFSVDHHLLCHQL
uniref:Uncharacterized protein n=1 Tax=Arundo donax TaxID=35708 RepID=A0A0A9ELI4_ARUDO